MTTPTIEELVKYASEDCEVSTQETFILAVADAWAADRAALASALKQLTIKDQERKSDEAIHHAQDANLVAENKHLREQLETAYKFIRAVADKEFTDGSFDYDDFLDVGQELGLVKMEPYDPEKHGEADCDAGDEFYVLALPPTPEVNDAQPK